MLHVALLGLHLRVLRLAKQVMQRLLGIVRSGTPRRDSFKQAHWGGIRTPSPSLCLDASRLVRGRLFLHPVDPSYHKAVAQKTGTKMERW